MKEETIRTLCKKKGFKDCDIFVKFFMLRFPDESDRIHSYCNEWIDRFMNGDPTGCMDGYSKKCYDKVIRCQ